MFRDIVERHIKQRDMHKYKYFAYGFCLLRTEMHIVQFKKKYISLYSLMSYSFRIYLAQIFKTIPTTDTHYTFFSCKVSEHKELKPIIHNKGKGNVITNVRTGILIITFSTLNCHSSIGLFI